MLAPSGTLAKSCFEYPIRADICSEVTSDPPQQQDAAEFLPTAAPDSPQQDLLELIPEASDPALAILP
jgi:hypothetical protein